MADTNYLGSVVKILEKPIQKIIDDKIVKTEFRVQLVHLRNLQMASLVFWGNLGDDIRNNYQVNDYIMVEGYLSLPNQKNEKFSTRPLKKAQITVLKVYSI
jgi:hypothetical protein